MSDEVLHARPAYEWTLNHVIEVADPRRGMLYVGIAVFVAVLVFAVLSLIESR